MGRKKRFFLRLAYPLLLVLLLPAAIYIYKNPAYNFDMLGYMALVIKMDQQGSNEQIHEITYSVARANLPVEEYSKLTETPSYRKKFEIEASQFEKILPNYVVKPLYLWTCWLFYKTGVSLPMATVLPSIISYVFLGLLLFHWLSKYLNAAVALMGTGLLMYSTFITAIARLSTPDLLSAVFLLVGFYFILERKSLIGMVIFFLLSILARADNIIPCFFIIAFLSFSKKWKSISRKQFFVMAACFVVSYVLIILPVRQFGWSIFYYSEYIKHIDYSRDFDQPVTLSSHLSLAYSKLITAFVSTSFTFFAFLGLLVLVNKKFSFTNISFDQSFLLLLGSIGLVKFLLLPDLSDRFYIGFYLVIIILLVRRFFPNTLTIVREDH
jgi:hypothetical protein